MKKIIGFLFVLQMSVVLFYSFFYLRVSNYRGLIYDGNASIILNFDDDTEAYYFFLELIEEEGLIASRIVRPNHETTTIYTTDVTLDGRIMLLEGEFPAIGTPEFVSTQRTGDEKQVGLIADIVPEKEIIIADMHSPRNFVLDGIYSINTTDLVVLENLVDELRTRLTYVGAIETEDSTLTHLQRTFLSLNAQEGFFIEMQWVEFRTIFPIITVCLLASVVQYVLNQLKFSAIFLMHGYSKTKVLQCIFGKLTRTFLLSTLIAYLLSTIYLAYIGRMVFLSGITQLFALFSILLILLYLSIGAVIATLSLFTFRIVTVLKGQKIDGKIQIFNHTIKGFFTAIFLVIFSFSIVNFQQLHERLNTFSYWEKAENVHRITTTSVIDRWGDLENRMISFYHDLISYHQGFMMDSNTIFAGDQAFELWGREQRLLDGSHEIYISPSFLEINPIYDLNGRNVIERLIINDYVLNVLIPEQFLDAEEEIADTFMSMFRGWRIMGDIDTNERQLNIIHVYDGQYYFSFDSLVRLAAGNRVRDPLVIIYYGRFADHLFTPSALTHSVYFHAMTNNPFREIEYLIHEHGLQVQIQRIESAYSQNASEIRAMQAHQARLLGLIGLILIANLAVAYNLVANYFERQKFQIFLKSTFGWSIIKQNLAFLTIYLTYMAPLIVILSFSLGGYVILFGLFVLAIDLVSMWLFQRRLLRKSFSEIMKGEH